MERLYASDIAPGGFVALDREQVHYLGRVLRLAQGDEVELFDGSGTLFQGEVFFGKKANRIEKLRLVRQADPPNRRFHLWQALPKLGKLDFVLQKAAELGAWSIAPFIARHGVARPDDPTAKVSRWESILQEACRQSENLFVPRMAPVSRLEDLPFSEMKTILVTHPGSDSLPLSALREEDLGCDVALLVGPEGGFHEEEVAYLTQSGASLLSLGPRVLRTETAGLAALAALQLLFGDGHKPRL